MTRAQITEELLQRSLPQQWTSFTKFGQVFKLIAHDFPKKTIETEDGGSYLCDPNEFWSRYLEDWIKHGEI